eukprot:4324296-Prymnesium_polylepis.1
MTRLAVPATQLHLATICLRSRRTCSGLLPKMRRALQPLLSGSRCCLDSSASTILRQPVPMLGNQCPCVLSFSAAAAARQSCGQIGYARPRRLHVA